MGHYVRTDELDSGGPLVIGTDGRRFVQRTLSTGVSARINDTDTPVRWVLIDLSEARTFDSHSVGELVRVTALVGAKGGRVGLVCPDTRLRRLFTLTGLAPIWTFFASEAAAREAMA